MAARTKALNVIPAVETAELTSIVSYNMPPAKSECKYIDADNMTELVELLHNEAKVI